MSQPKESFAPTDNDKEEPGAQSSTWFFISDNSCRGKLLLSYLRAGHAGDITANILQGVVQDLEHIQTGVSV